MRKARQRCPYQTPWYMAEEPVRELVEKFGPTSDGPVRSFNPDRGGLDQGDTTQQIGALVVTVQPRGAVELRGIRLGVIFLTLGDSEVSNSNCRATSATRSKGIRTEVRGTGKRLTMGISL